MSIIDSIRLAWTSLTSNLLRSSLTALGIVIAVASVILLVAVGSGARSDVEGRIAGLGSNMLVVFSGSSRVMGRSMGAGTDKPLTESDLQAIREKVDGIVAIAGLLTGAGPVIYGNTNWTTSLAGIHADFATVRDWPLVAGRDLTPQDLRNGAKVAVLGETVVEKLFRGSDPIGALIRIKNTPFQVVGVLGPKGQTSMGRDQDDVVHIPMTTARNHILGKNQTTPDQVGQIYVKFDPGVSLKEAQVDIEQLLRGRRKIQTGKDDDFEVRNLAEFMKARNEVLSTMTYLLGATSIISLIVGGIGIMNIMLVSVTERTREIGLRMAVGGRKSDILRQFLVEAVVLCVVGGGLGSFVGVAVAHGIATAANWPVLVSPNVIVAAVLLAGATGVLFGYLPARRAAYLNPVDALKSE